jgi:hypothetical protein
MRRSEQILVGLDEGAAGAMLRVGLGYVTGTAWLILGGLGSPEWTVLPFFLAVLIAVRLLPAVIRRAMHFSEPVRTVWAERRQLAKRFDSYQWQKVFWIGLGLTLRLASSDRRPAALVALAAACLAAGTLGLATWHIVRTRESQA